MERLAQEGSISSEDADVMRRVAANVRAGVERYPLPMQPLHGDAHLGNVIATVGGSLWTDWEDTFLGPVAWDLACLQASAPPFGHRDPRLIATARAGYGDDLDTGTLAAFTDARRFQASVWGVVIGLSRPDAQQRVQQQLAWLRHRAHHA